MEIDYRVIIASIINFLIFFFIMKKLVFNKTIAIINKRQQYVSDTLNKCKEQEERTEYLKNQYEREMENYKEEGLRYVKSYKEKADKVYADIIDSAQKDAQIVRNKADEEVEREKKKAEKQLKTEVVDLSVKLTKKALKREIDEECHRKLIDEFISEV